MCTKYHYISRTKYHYISPLGLPAEHAGLARALQCCSTVLAQPEQQQGEERNITELQIFGIPWLQRQISMTFPLGFLLPC